MRPVRLSVLLWMLGSAGALAPPLGADGSDLTAARALFEANLDAIRRHDRAAYLACYLESEALARTGPEGFELGFKGLAATAGESWPDHFEALDLELVAVGPGVVYGTYRYRVRYGGREQTGLSERLFVRSAAGWRIAVTSAFPAPPGTPPPPLALVGATLIDGSGAAALADAVVVVRGGKIDCAGTRASCAIPSGVETVELAGHWITPGLVDAHVHFSQTGWVDGRPDAYDARQRYPYEAVQAELRAHPQRWYRAYLCSGVTSVFDVGGYPWTLALGQSAESDSMAPRLVAAGPLLSTIDFWLNLPGEKQFIYLADPEVARAAVRYLAAQGARAIKIWFIVTPEADFEAMAAAVLAAGGQAQRAGLPLIVHATGLREAKLALRAGARLLVHSVWEQPIDDEFIELALAQKTIYCPTLTVRSGYGRFFRAVLERAVPTIDDPNGCVDAQTRERIAASAGLDPGAVDPVWKQRLQQGDAELVAIGARNLKRLHQAGVPIAMGSDAGNPLTPHGPSVYSEMEAMQAAGLKPMEVLTAATRGGALALGREAELGTVATGKLADLLVLGADPAADIANLRQLRYVVRGGVLRSAAELKSR